MADILGVIGGSGLYEMEGLKNVRTVSVKTPFGDPSDAMVVGELEERTIRSSRGTAGDTGSSRRKSITARISML
jgi:purine nucleoside phosphorylase